MYVCVHVRAYRPEIPSPQPLKQLSLQARHKINPKAFHLISSFFLFASFPSHLPFLLRMHGEQIQRANSFTPNTSTTNQHTPTHTGDTGIACEKKSLIDHATPHVLAPTRTHVHTQNAHNYDFTQIQTCAHMQRLKSTHPHTRMHTHTHTQHCATIDTHNDNISSQAQQH